MDTHDSSTDETLDKRLTDNLSLLRIYAFKLTGDACRADDLLQETTVKVLCNSDRYAVNINFRGWVMTVMYNLFVNERIRSSRSVSVSDGAIFDGKYSDSYVSSHEIMRVINSLPIDYSLPFSMYADGYKYHEIAARLNIPIGTVKSRIHTARTRLQLMLRDYVR